MKMTHDLPESRSIERKAHNTNGCEFNLCQSSDFASINLSKSVCEGSKIKIGKILEFLRGRIGQIRRPVFVNNNIEINDNLKINNVKSIRASIRKTHSKRGFINEMIMHQNLILVHLVITCQACQSRRYTLKFWF